MGYPIRKWNDVLSIISGKNQKVVADSSGQYPIYGSGGIMGYANNYLCEAGTTIIGRKGTINRPIFVNERFWNVDTAFGVFPGEMLHPKFLFYFCQSFNFKALDKSTTIPSLAKRDLLNIEMPVPSFPEQEHIISRIEELFSQLDASVAELKMAKERLKVYRQAVLKEAFAICSETVRIRELCNVVRGGSPRPAGDERFYNGTIPFLKVADLTNIPGMYLTKFSSTIKKAGLKRTRLVSANTLLLSNSGATLGVPKICRFQTTFNDGIAAFLDLDEKREYLPYHYYFWMSQTLALRAINQGAAQPNLNTAIIGNVLIPHCSYAEQKEISQQIEARLSVCDNIEKTVDTALQQAEALRQSILKKAFEGGL